MPVTDREVWQHFQDQTDNAPEVIALAYASFAKAKYDWADHFEAREGHPPSVAEVERWIADQPDSRLDELLRVALDFFDVAARAYMAPDIEQAAAEATDAAIVHEVKGIGAQVKQATSFWRNVGPNVVVGVVASLVFSLLIMIAAAIYLGDPSPFALLRHSRVEAPPAGK